MLRGGWDALDELMAALLDEEPTDMEEGDLRRGLASTQ
jgi:hypothetical protein